MGWILMADVINSDDLKKVKIYGILDKSRKFPIKIP